MFSWHAIPFARLLLPFAAGIILYEYIPDLAFPALVILCCTLAISAVQRLLPPNAFFYKKRYLAGILISIALLSTAVLRTRCKEADLIPSHYSKFANPAYLRLNVVGALSEKSKYHRGIVRVEAVVDQSGKTHTACGRLLIRVPKHRLNKRLRTGERFISSASLSLPDGPANPGDFDYRTYLKRKQILHILNVGNGKLIPIEASGTSIVSMAENLRDACLVLLRKYITDPVSAGVAEALLLGYKDDLNPEIAQTFTNTGTLHILAVSGLHAGMVFLILNFISGFVRRLPRGKYIQTLLILSGLWFYACMTGLSSSVIRACVMFSIISAGKLFDRKQNILNTLFGSAFLMLLADPDYLFDPGFQLSYTAVAGIVLFFPAISGLYAGAPKILRFILDTSSVTIAAQILTFPLSLFYFGQFPTYFLISNLVVVPVFSLLLIMLVVLIPLAVLPSAALLLGTVIHLLIRFSSDFLKWTDSWPHALLNGLFLSLLGAVLLYAFILLAYRCLLLKNKQMFFSGLLVLIAFSCLNAVRTYKIQNQKFIAVHSIRGHDVFTCVQGAQAYVVSDSAFFRKKGIEKQLTSFLRIKGIRKVIEVADHKAFVSTNLKQIPKIGFQFFDRIMTIRKTVHLSVHPKVNLVLKGSTKSIEKHLEYNCNNLILSNKMGKSERDEILRLIFEKPELKAKISTNFRIIPVEEN